MYKRDYHQRARYQHQSGFLPLLCCLFFFALLASPFLSFFELRTVFLVFISLSIILYFSLIRDDVISIVSPPSYDSFNQSRIIKSENQDLQLKHGQYCVNCGKGFTLRSNYCPYCGTKSRILDQHQ